MKEAKKPAKEPAPKEPAKARNARAARLRQLRGDLSQREQGALTGINHRTLAKWEAGTPPGGDLLAIYCWALAAQRPGQSAATLAGWIVCG